MGNSTKRTVAGEGGTAQGGVGSIEYTYSPATHTETGFNTWSMRTTLMYADSTIRRIYSNTYGQIMLVNINGTGGWSYYTQYDTRGREVMSAGPSGLIPLVRASLDVSSHS